jgi:hypothetical protein
VKIKILLASFAILAAVFVIGCSNGGQTTAPQNSISSLNIHNDVNSNRFEPATTIAGPEGPEPPYEHIIGTYQCDQSGCNSLFVKKGIYLELHFEISPPPNLRNGMPVMVQGVLSSVPSDRCQLWGVFDVQEIDILGERTHGEENNGNVG